MPYISVPRLRSQLGSHLELVRVSCEQPHERKVNLTYCTKDFRLLLWTPTYMYGRRASGRLPKTYIEVLKEDTGLELEDQSEDEDFG